MLPMLAKFQCAYRAVRAGDLATLKAWLSARHPLDIDVNEISEDATSGQITLLMTAIHETEQKRSHAVAQMLLEHGAAPNLGCGAQHDTPLHNARDARMVELLLAHGAHIDARTVPDDDTPLAWAVLDRRFDVLRALLNNGAALGACCVRDDPVRGLSRPLDIFELADEQLVHVFNILKHVLEDHEFDEAKREIRRIIDLLAAVRSAGSWKRYERERVIPLLSLRYLCLAGRATAPARLLRLFGSAPMPKCAARTRSKRLAHSAAQRPLPDEVFEHVLTFWDGI